MTRFGIALLSLCVLVPVPAAAQDTWPNRQIRMVVPLPAGASVDVIGRLVAAKLGERLGQTVVIENRAGASGAIGADAVARAAPDGYTLGMATTTTHVTNAIVNSKLVYDPVKDFTPIAMIGVVPYALSVSPKLPVKDVRELIALAKSKPGELLYASAGRGSATHLCAETFNLMAGTKMLPVHYRGGAETLKDLISGQMKIMFSSIAPVQELVRQGRLHGLAVTGPKRDRTFPDVPTVAEAGLPGYDVRFWVGLTAPRGTPMTAIKRIEAANNKALQLPEVQAALAAQGFSPWIGTAEDFDAFYRVERDKYAKVIRASGMDKE